MAVGGVDEVGNITECRANRSAEIKSRRYMVSIQQTYRAEQHIAVLADATFQPATDKTADILQIAALLLWQFRVFLRSLRCAHRVLVAPHDVLPFHLLVFILFVSSAVTHRNFYFLAHAAPPCYMA